MNLFEACNWLTSAGWQVSNRDSDFAGAICLGGSRDSGPMYRQFTDSATERTLLEFLGTSGEGNVCFVRVWTSGRNGRPNISQFVCEDLNQFKKVAASALKS